MSATAQAVLDYSPPGARLVFSCGWHITLDGQDVYSWKLNALVKVGGRLARLARFADLDDQVETCRRVFASDTRWTVVRGSGLEFPSATQRRQTSARILSACGSGEMQSVRPLRTRSERTEITLAVRLRFVPR